MTLGPFSSDFVLVATTLGSGTLESVDSFLTGNGGGALRVGNGGGVPRGRFAIGGCTVVIVFSWKDVCFVTGLRLGTTGLADTFGLFSAGPRPPATCA